MEHIQPTSPQSISDPSISTPKKPKKKVTFNANASYRNIEYNMTPDPPSPINRALSAIADCVPWFKEYQIVANNRFLQEQFLPVGDSEYNLTQEHTINLRDTTSTLWTNPTDLTIRDTYQKQCYKTFCKEIQQQLKHYPPPSISKAKEVWYEKRKILIAEKFGYHEEKYRDGTIA